MPISSRPRTRRLLYSPSPPAAGFTVFCPTTRSCVPQSGTTSRLDGIGRPVDVQTCVSQFRNSRISRRKLHSEFGRRCGNTLVRDCATLPAGPVTVFQESTYQPDTTWRWMGSAAMDKEGNFAIGYSASSASIFPQIRYAGRLATDPLNTLGQGEATLFAGTGSQTGTGSRWGDYARLTVDPVDDCTFWFTSEYYATTSQFNWRTRIGSFRFPTCGSSRQRQLRHQPLRRHQRRLQLRHRRRHQLRRQLRRQLQHRRRHLRRCQTRRAI